MRECHFTTHSKHFLREPIFNSASQTCIHSSEYNPSSSLALCRTSYEYRPIHVFPWHDTNKEAVKRKERKKNMQNFAPGEVTHVLPCLSTQNFSPPNPPMTPSANMDFPFWRLPKPSPRGCSALSWRKGGWEMRCRAPRHMHKHFCVSA